MKLDIKKIEENLDTSFLGRNIIYHEQIDSTQDEAKRLIKKKYKKNNKWHIYSYRQTNTGQRNKGQNMVW